MSDTNQGIERRKLPRLEVNNYSFAVIKHESDNIALGRILDINKGGLAFLYGAENNVPWPNGSLDIFTVDSLLCVTSLPFRLVSDGDVPKVNQFSSVAMRRCGVQFGPLSKSQEAQIDIFLEKHTLQGAMDAQGANSSRKAKISSLA